MQGQNTQKSDNVVSLFAKKAKGEGEQDVAENGADKESFDDVMTRNMKNKERLEKERLTANKSVLRSYRIKH